MDVHTFWFAVNDAEVTLKMLTLRAKLACTDLTDELGEISGVEDIAKSPKTTAVYVNRAETRGEIVLDYLKEIECNLICLRETLNDALDDMQREKEAHAAARAAENSPIVNHCELNG